MNKKSRNQYIALGWIFIVLSVLLLGGLALLRNPMAPKEVGMLANWGDWAGGVTAPLLSIAGYFFIYAAFRQQSKDALAGQQQFLQQQFETTFFNLINLHNQNVSAIQQGFREQGESHFFAYAHQFLQDQCGPQSRLEKVKQRYNHSFYADNYNHIDHFVRHLLFCLQYVDESTALSIGREGARHSQDQKQRFVDILLAQLSTDELFLLFYHCLSRPEVVPSTRQRLSRYGVFERLYRNDLLLDASHAQAYKKADQA